MNKLLMTTVIVCLCGFWLMLAIPASDNVKIDTASAISQLTTLEQQDASEIQNRIKKIEQKLALEGNGRSLAQRYQHAVIVGDSMVHALSDYQALPARSLYGAIGKRTDNIFEELDKALKTNPDQLFLCLGLNDLSTYRKRTHLFIEKYQKVIDHIKARNRHTKIYINSMIPLPKATIKKHSEYQYIDDYNKAMKQLCEDNHLTYIDNTQLIKPEAKYFEGDGIHPKYAYFRDWIHHMANEAMLP